MLPRMVLEGHFLKVMSLSTTFWEEKILEDFTPTAQTDSAALGFNLTPSPSTFKAQKLHPTGQGTPSGPNPVASLGHLWPSVGVY